MPSTKDRLGLLRYVPALTIALFLGPVVAGLAGTILPGFGYLPTLGGHQLSLDPWRALLAEPGLSKAILLTGFTGFGSTVLAFALTILVFASGHGTLWFNRAKRAMTPLLAVPHLAMAVGLAQAALDVALKYTAERTPDAATSAA